MKKLIISFSIAAIIIIITATFFYKKDNELSSDNSHDELIVKVNEIEQLCLLEDIEEAREKAYDLKIDMQSESIVKSKDNSAIYFMVICLIFLFIIYTYCYYALVRPFEKLTDFAEKVANGDFDLPLNYERTNYFGKFTWAFDHMRREITKARSAEKEAIENNKTVIASLSHDIRTPVASIRAYAEGLEAGMDINVEKRAKYLEVIIRKCDDVTKLTDDILLHSLSDMDKLKILTEPFELCEFLTKVINDISVDKGDVQFFSPTYLIHVKADKERTAQIIENLINNARKYAKSKIDISVKREGDFAKVCFRDYGSGIDDRDMPFIWDKFYRGHNSKNEQGSGLGLYIVKYIAIQSGGDASIENLTDGLLVTVLLPIA